MAYRSQTTKEITMVEESKVQKLNIPKLNIKDEKNKIDVITQLVDYMEAHEIVPTDILGEWYLRKIG